MKLANDQASLSVPRLPALDHLVTRLERLSCGPEYAVLRETLLGRAMKPYLEGSRILAPLAEEVDLATLILYCDVYPDTGQLSLIERLRDVVTEHIAQEERIWLDPLKHSYTDLLEVAEFRDGGELVLRSMGDSTTFRFPYTDALPSLGLGDALLSRVIRRPDAYESGEAVWAGPSIVLAQPDAQAIMDMTGEWRRNIEMNSGSFALGEWQEFAKRFGHMLLWAYAELRLAALVDAVAHIQYRTPDGQPYLYSTALYDHHAYQMIAQGMDAMTGLLSTSPSGTPFGQPVRRWAEQRSSNGSWEVVARITLTPAQILVECDGPERLNGIKHRLARAFGFTLHFRDETVTPPVHRVRSEQLMKNQPFRITITTEEDLLWLKEFLDKAYLEWSDQPHQALGGQTPRHAFATMRDQVTALINEME
ncbi:MAG TPA: hypothetical protein VIT63_02650, partial [Nitrospira sp.]